MSEQGSIYYKIGLDNKLLRVHASEASNIIRRVGNSAVNEGTRIDGAFNNIGKKIAGAFSIAAVTQFGRQVIAVRKEIESLEISFRTLLGNESKADKLFGEIRQFAVNTPMQLKDLASAAQLMLSFNIDEDKIMPYLKALGDVSMGDTQKFQGLALAFSQMSSAGKLMGQDLMQMINAGFNPLAQMAEKSGKSLSKLKDEMAAGKISAEMVQQAFIEATSQGGKFYGMLESQSKGLKGSISNLQGAWEDMLNSIGESSQGIVSEGINGLTYALKHYEQFGRILAGIIVTYGAYRAAVIAVNACKEWATITEAAHYQALLMTEKAQKLLNATMLKNPYVLLATLIAGVVAAYMSMKTHSELVKDAEEEYQRTLQETIDKEKEHRREIDELCDIAGDESLSTDTRRKALLKLIDKYPDIFAQYDTEIEALKDIKKLKEEIAILDGKTSMENPKNQLAEVNKEIERLEAIEATKTTISSGTQYGTVTQTVGGLDKEGKAKLEQLYKERNKLQKREKSETVNAYFADLTGISNEDLERQINVRKDLLARMAIDKKDGVKRVGKIVSETDVTNGTFSEEELKSQLKKLQLEEGRRSADKKTGAGWQAKAKQEYEKALKAYNDFVNGNKNTMDEGAFTKEAEKLKSDLEKAKKEYEKYKPATDKDSEKATTNANRITVETAERQKKMEEQSKALARQARDAEHEVSQARIDGMKDGLEKELAQNDLNYQKMLDANDDRKADMLKSLRDYSELQWQNDNPNAKKEGKVFDRSSVPEELLDTDQDFDFEAIEATFGKDIASMVETMRSQLVGFAGVAEQTYATANKNSLESALADFKGYEQQRQDVVDEFKRKRESLYEHDEKGNRTGLLAGVTEDNVAELDYQEQESLKMIDEQFAMRSEEYQAWCEKVASMSIDRLQELLTQAKDELDRMEKEGGADPNKLAQQRATVNKLDSTLKKAQASDKVNPGKRSIKEWGELYSALTTCEKEFEKIGDAVGGTAGEILKTAGQIATASLSMINGIVTLANSSMTATEATSKTTAASIATVEKASVILTVISAALQVATAIANMFNNDDKKEKEIEHLQNRIDQLQWELDNAQAIHTEQYLKKGSYLKTVRDALIDVQYEAIQTTAILGRQWTMLRRIPYTQDDIKAKAKEIAKEYANIGYSVSSMLGEDKFYSAKDQLANIAEQQLTIQQQIDAEKGKKHTDGQRIQEWENKITELGQKAVEIINGMVEEIMGGSAEDLARGLADAFIDAFEAGEDAAEAWHKKVNEIVGDIIRKMLVQTYLEKPVAEIFDKYKDKWFKDGQYVGGKTVIESMTSLADELDNTRMEWEKMWNDLSPKIKDILGPEEEFSQEGSSGGFAAMSQDSADELNGRFTALQINAEAIRQHLVSMKEIMEESRNIALLSMGYLENIDRNTRELYGMSSKLDKIITNTENL